MTRRVARLVAEGLVRRANAQADARGVVVALTDAGVARLAWALSSACQAARVGLAALRHQPIEKTSDIGFRK